VFRSKWGALGTLHRRYGGCQNNVRGTALKAQGEEYRNLEFFMSYMSNGLAVNGPGSRK
jgi:sulfur-oxidizing protein SoxA